MTDTPNLALPYILAAQAQKHVTHNEAIRAIDCLVQLGVDSRLLAAPPSSPAEGARYVVAAAATGDWTGESGKIAAFQDGAWAFYAPKEGWVAWVASEAVAIVYAGGAWSLLPANGLITDHGALTGLGDDDHSQYHTDARGDARYTPIDPTTLGVNATADTTNRLALSSPASLFNHEGAGHQIKVNKNAAADTASFLFQDGFSGRAEIGLTGDDDFHFKVSPDGSVWNEALKIDKTTGEVTFPAVGQIIVQRFTSSGTWTKPVGAKRVRVQQFGGGGGAGGGARVTSGTACSGGGGGGGAGTSTREFDASDLTSTVTVTVAAGGTGGAGATSNGTPGSDGVAGGTSTFGSYSQACGGGAGSGGQVSGNSAGGGGGAEVSTGGNASGATAGTAVAGALSGATAVATALLHGGGGGAGGNGTTGVAGESSHVVSGSTGGGAGGGLSAAPAANAGGRTRLRNVNVGTGGIAGTTGGGNGGAGANYPPGGGCGGGGGGSNTAGVGGAGGVGGTGGGGGGGGAAIGGNGGTGGTGGRGEVVVITYR
jgi:hypothetical protein